MNTEPISNYCLKCHAPLPASAPEGLCRKCLLAAVATPTEAGQPANAGATVPPPLETVAAAFPQLEILELIGSGGMGVVYKARQPRLDRCVALKLLPHSLAADPAFAERFNREARVFARLNHPGIVTVYDYGDAGGFFFLLMEFVDGVNLRQAMQAGRFTPQQAFGLVPKICEALQFAHDEGILHRDIKPENILLDSKGRVKIADFGIAKLVGEQRPVTKLTATGAAIGTPNYMAPEQLEHPEDVDQRGDIYSIGVVFYEMLTGELPIGRFAPPSKKTSMDERVDEIVLKALARERELRQQSASEVKTQVEGLATPPSSAPPAAPAVSAATAALPPQAPTTKEGWSRLAIWGAVLTGLSLPIPFLLLLAVMLGRGSIGAFELLIIIGCVMCLAVPGTLLGWMGLSQIRRSHGQLQGLHLALFAALWWPLLFPFLAVLLPPVMIIAPEPVWWGPALLLLPIAVLIFDVWAVRAAARWGSGSAPKENVSPPSAPNCQGVWLGLPARTRLWVKAAVILLAIALAYYVWSLIQAKTSKVSSPPLPSSEQSLSLDISAPPRETLVITGIVLSNNVPVSGRELRAKLPPPNGRKSSPFVVRWQTVNDASSGTPWEIVVEDKTSDTIGARLRPTNLPQLVWTSSPQGERTTRKTVTHEAWAFEVARALQTTGGGNAGAADWSVRLQFQSAPPSAHEFKARH